MVHEAITVAFVAGVAWAVGKMQPPDSEGRDTKDRDPNSRPPRIPKLGPELMHRRGVPNEACRPE